MRICAWRNNDITHLKSNAVYCSTTCRSQAHRASPCYYCGMPASEKEYIIPLSHKRFNNTNTVPTCYECNRLAGTSEFATVEEKRLHIKRLILKKYKKIINMPKWTETELEELGPVLKAHVQSTIELQELTWLRLAWELKPR